MCTLQQLQEGIAAASQTLTLEPTVLHKWYMRILDKIIFVRTASLIEQSNLLTFLMVTQSLIRAWSDVEELKSSRKWRPGQLAVKRHRQA